MPTEKRLEKLKRVARQRQAGLTVVIEDVFDPHNLGAVARSCDAFGVQQIHIIFEAQAAFDPKAAGKNSSTATNKWLEYRTHHSTEAGLRALKADGWQIAATVIDADAESIYSADLTQPRLALLFGNERDGLSRQALELADRRLTVPMLGIAQSLNVSVTASLALYEVTRQRRLKGAADYAVDADGQARTLAYFLRMHESLKRRNKTLRKRRARKRFAKTD